MYIDLNRESTEPLIKQLLDGLRTGILNGTLEAHHKMPSSRALAMELGVSRSTVVNGYDQLIAEGYLYGIEGSGTYVCEGIEFEGHPQSVDSEVLSEPEMLFTVPQETISFRAGVPDLASIPIDLWGRLYREVTLTVTGRQLDYYNVFGALELRKVLSDYLRRVRGVVSAPSNIVITSGAAQAFSLLSKLIPEGGFAVIENPVSTGLVDTLKTQGVHCHPVAVDHNGLCTDQLPDYSPSLVFTTPSHQFPTGVVMSARRRIELIRYAMDKQAYIVEDDYDSEFRYEGSPIQSMQSLAPDQVIYVGTFSKTLMPAIRMGYMVLPNTLIRTLRKEKYASDLHSPILEQLTMAKFIEGGFMDRHISRMRKLYRKRRAFLVSEIRRFFGDKVTVSGDGAGLHLILTFQGMDFNPEIIETFMEEGVHAVPVKNHCMTVCEDYSNQLIMGFGNTDIEMIGEGLVRMKKAMTKR